MPVFETRDFGRISYEPEARFHFSRGLPGFENLRWFIPLYFEPSGPLVFLQSLEDPGLCFITLPVLVVDPDYRLGMSREDLELIGLNGSKQPRIGADVLCLAVISLRESGPTANLLAPVVVNAASHEAVQAVATEPGYSHRHVLAAEEAPVCS